jgi:hypothetical protein
VYVRLRVSPVSVMCQRRDVALCVDKKCFLVYRKKEKIPETFQAVQMDLPTQNWGLSWKCKE